MSDCVCDNSDNMASGNKNYYTNQAFCQKSECYDDQQRGFSPERRYPPIGAYKPSPQEIYHQRGSGNVNLPPLGPKPKIVRSNSIAVQNTNNRNIQIVRSHSNGNLDDQEYYEDVLVNDPLDVSNGNGVKYERNIVKTSSPNTKTRYAVIQTQQEEVLLESRSPKHRYEYIPMQEQPNGYPSSPRKKMVRPQEETEVNQRRMHRYAVIPDDETEPEPAPKRAASQSGQNNRYALVPVSEIKPNMRYAVVTTEEMSRNRGRYDYIPEDNSRKQYVTSPPTPRKANPIATQKLHELLATPKKPVRPNTIPLSPNPFRTPTNSPPSQHLTPKPPKQLQTPRAQQKLNYTLSTRQNPNIMHSPLEQQNKRHTAVIAPICSSPVQSVYSETTFSNKTESWMNLSQPKAAGPATLVVAAVMMILCGSLTSGLCFYMVSLVGRMYYLDFGTISGFACLLLGLLGMRSRNCYWLPNRNYISGMYIKSINKNNLFYFKK